MIGGLGVQDAAALLVTQKVEAALAVADRVAFDEHGAIKHEAAPAALDADPEPPHRCVGVGR